MKIIGNTKNLKGFDVESVEDMGKMATAISHTYSADAAAILLIKDKTVGCYFGAMKEIDGASIKRFVRETGLYFTQLSVKLESGEIQPADFSPNVHVFPSASELNKEPSSGDDWSTAV